MSTTTKTLGAIADEVLALAEKASKGPWQVRPNKHDDWGCVRGPDGHIVLMAHAGEYVRDYDEHRVAVTDPYKHNADYAAHTRTSAPALARGVKEMEERLRVAEDALRFYADWMTTLPGKGDAGARARAALARIAAPVEVGNGKEDE